MVLDWRNSEYRQDNLRAELNAASEKMAATLAAHLAEEKELRVKRSAQATLFFLTPISLVFEPRASM